MNDGYSLGDYRCYRCGESLNPYTGMIEEIGGQDYCPKCAEYKADELMERAYQQRRDLEARR